MVCQAANTLTDLGVTSGDRVAIYMPMIPETVVSMLACARIGAPHTVVFGGFSADALRTRIHDCDARIVITSDGAYRRGKASGLKSAVDEALLDCPDVRNVLVVRRTGQEVDWTPGRDIWWHESVELASADHDAEAFDAEHPLYVMYTSGTTGKPKGILHTTGGYLTACAYTHWAVFDLKAESDIFWTAADIGWVTGHSYIVYGPLANGATSVLYEGTPDTPHQGRWWEIIDKYKVSILYCAPTAIRTFMKWGAADTGQVQPRESARDRHRGRTDQPGCLHLVPGEHRAQPNPRRGHLVADRDRSHHDQSAPGSYSRQTGRRHEGTARGRGRRRQ